MGVIQFKNGTIQFKGGTIQFKVSNTTRYYTDGTQNVAWEHANDGAVNFLADSMSINTGLAGTYEHLMCTAVTSAAVDLTNITTLYIDWSGSNIGTNASHMFSVSSTKSGGSVASFSASAASFSRTLNSLNVSGLSGSYYIRITSDIQALDMGGRSSTIAYNVWGE